MEHCDKCGELILDLEHRCSPAWWVCGDDMGEEDIPRLVYAFHSDEAAEKYAKEMDKVEGVVNDKYRDVYVRLLFGSEVVKFTVRSEVVPVYIAMRDDDYIQAEGAGRAEIKDARETGTGG